MPAEDKTAAEERMFMAFSLELQEQLNTLILPVLALFDAAAAEEKQLRQRRLLLISLLSEHSGRANTDTEYLWRYCISAGSRRYEGDLPVPEAGICLPD